ncbi:MAG: hypothetical protein WD969_11645 [Paracoccaceae bacterium]
MKLLFTSHRASGAYVMRGEQIAARRSAWRASLTPDRADLRRADALVVVKSADDDVLRTAREIGLPVIHDALDFWPQVKSALMPPSRAQRLRAAEDIGPALFYRFRRLSPALIICATDAMARDLADYPAPKAVVRHHADPRLKPARAGLNGTAPRLLYFGKSVFLGEWNTRIARICQTLGAEFTPVDIGCGAWVPPPPASAMIAVRGGRDGSWLSRRWKSNVKAATAQALGLPFVAWPEAAYLETAPESYWFEDEASLTSAVSAALSPEARRLSRRFTAEDSAKELEAAVERGLGGAFGMDKRALMV